VLEIGKGPARQRALPCQRLLRTAQALAINGFRCGHKRWKQAKIDVHRLKRARTCVDRLDVAAGDMAEQRAKRGGRRRQMVSRRSFCICGRKQAGEQADRRRLDIALASRHLAGEAQPRIGAQSQACVEQLR
jgi:hypothetical protein